MRLKSILNSRRGMAIVYVMMIVAVVTIASVTLWQVTEHDIRKAEQEEDRSQAYYYAKSGVEIAVGMILNNLDNEDLPLLDGVTYYGKLGDPVFTTTIPLDETGKEDYNVSFTVKVTSDEKEITYDVRSAGLSGSARKSDSTVSGSSMNTLGFQITHSRLAESAVGGQGGETGDDVPPIVGSDLKARYAVFAKELIDLNTGSTVIVGDIGTGSGPVRFNYSSGVRNAEGDDGVVYLGPGAQVIYPQWRTKNWEEIGYDFEPWFPPTPGLPATPVVPAYPALPDISDAVNSGDITSGRTVSLQSGGITRYGRVAVDWNNVLTFDLHGDATVFIDSLSLNGEIRLSGQGNLLMVVESGIKDDKSVINGGGDPSRLTLYVKGTEITLNSGGSGSAISGTVFAPNASFYAKNGTNINGDLIIGGEKLEFTGVSHNGALYALNEEAEILYNGNRALVKDVYTLIYTNGKKLSVSPAHIKGELYLTNPEAQILMNGRSTFTGNILTEGNKIEITGGTVLRGHIVAPNPDAVISYYGEYDHIGALITGGRSVSYSGGAAITRGLLFAPEADIQLAGSAKFYGSMVSKNFAAIGNNTVTYEEMIYDDLPVDFELTETESTKPNWRVFGRWITD